MFNRLTMMALTWCICTTAVHAADYRDLDWLELLPEQERMTLLNQGPIDHGGETSPQRQPALGGNNSLSQLEVEAAWTSVNVVDELAEQAVRLPGFVVPLEYNDNQDVIEFFLVPFFGACIHVPAPPPNQIIHVSIPEGFELSSIYEPYVVEGKVQISLTERELGISAYSIVPDAVVPYER